MLRYKLNPLQAPWSKLAVDHLSNIERCRLSRGDAISEALGWVPSLDSLKKLSNRNTGMKCQELINLLEENGYVYKAHPFSDAPNRHGGHWPDVGDYPCLVLTDGNDHDISRISLFSCEDYEEFLKEVHQPYPVEYTFTGRDGHQYVCSLLETMTVSSVCVKLRVYGADGYLVVKEYTGTETIDRLMKEYERHVPAGDRFGMNTHVLLGRQEQHLPTYVMYRVPSEPGAEPLPWCLVGFDETRHHGGQADYSRTYATVRPWTRAAEEKERGRLIGVNL